MFQRHVFLIATALERNPSLAQAKDERPNAAKATALHYAAAYLNIDNPGPDQLDKAGLFGIDLIQIMKDNRCAILGQPGEQ